MKVAIAHDWLTGMRGGERVLESLLEVWPDATVYTLFHDRGKVSRAIEDRLIVVSPLDRVPGIYRNYRNLLPLFPAAIGALEVGRCDLMISSSHAVAKGIRAPGATHISYCHTPMRYIWDAESDYAPTRLQQVGLSLFRERLREWDRTSAARVDHFHSQLEIHRGSDPILLRPKLHHHSSAGRHRFFLPPPESRQTSSSRSAPSLDTRGSILPWTLSTGRAGVLLWLGMALMKRG